MQAFEKEKHLSETPRMGLFWRLRHAELCHRLFENAGEARKVLILRHAGRAHCMGPKFPGKMLYSTKAMKIQTLKATEEYWHEGLLALRRPGRYRNLVSSS
jgi:hypothetical protein